MARDGKSTLKTLVRFRKSGISYICSNCGILLYHIGADAKDDDLSLLQPSDVAAEVGRCHPAQFS
jgi:hypothetical protein